MKKNDLLQGGEENKKEPSKPLPARWYCIEHFDEPRKLKTKARPTTLAEFDGGPLAKWFKHNAIVGVL